MQVTVAECTRLRPAIRRGPTVPPHPHTMIIALALLAVLATSAAAPGPAPAPAAPAQYSSRFSSVDVDKILSNPRVLANYVKCVTDKGPCTSEGKEIKRILPEVIATSCERCSPQLKTNVRKTVRALQQKHPEAWASVVNKYDPQRKRAKDLETFLKA